MARRPLSPHVSIYRFGYTMSLSFLHRISGVALGAGLAVELGGRPLGEDAYLVSSIGGAADERLMASCIAFLYHFAMNPAL